MQGVHEVGVGPQPACSSIVTPSFQAGPRARITRKSCGSRYSLVKSMYQLVSQLLPSSAENACSQRAESPATRDQM